MAEKSRQRLTASAGISRDNFLQTKRPGPGRIDTAVFPLHCGPGVTAGIFIWLYESTKLPSPQLLNNRAITRGKIRTMFVDCVLAAPEAATEIFEKPGSLFRPEVLRCKLVE